MKFWNMKYKDVLKKFGSSTEGLSNSEAKKRLEKYGENKLQEAKKESILKKFIYQFKDFLIILLLIAAVVSGIIDYNSSEGLLNTYVIIFVVLANAFVGVFQEVKSEKSLDSLKKLTEHTSKVVRNGKTIEVKASELVVGDILVLSAGDYASADLRLIEAVNLKVDESQLTGESTSVDKFVDVVSENASLGDRQNMVFTSSLITRGRGKGIVIATGMDTEVGKIATLLNESEDKETPLKVRLNGLGKSLGIASIIICVIIFILGILQGRPALSMIITAISLAVAAIPEGLPAIATIVQAIGVQKMAKKNAVVKKLPAVETLGSSTVICSDKTGTLTQNNMTVTEIFHVQDTDFVKEQMLNSMVLCNDSKVDFEKNEEVGDPTETALIKYAKNEYLKYDLDMESVSNKDTRVYEVPFSSELKFMITVNRDQVNNENKIIAYIKGGIDEVLSMVDKEDLNSKLENAEEKIKEVNLAMANNALRVLGFGYFEIGEFDLTISPEDFISKYKGSFKFTGMVGMIDPPRPEAKAAVMNAKKAGIKTIMITGDHALTAKAIAKELGILENDDEIMVGNDLDKLTKEELVETVKVKRVYARVSPKHKVMIVEALQSLGEIVAMTGDGVNDAPALKKADIGCAMGKTGTDVSKEAADIIITDDNFASIVDAVEEGRRIYDNILKAVQYLLSANIGELLVILISILMTSVIASMYGIPNAFLGELIPLIAIQILWINLVTDTFPALALSEDPSEEGVMKRKPNISKNIFSKNRLVHVMYQGIMIGLITLTAFLVGLSVEGTTELKIRTAQTMAFMTLGFAELVHIYNVRNNFKSVFSAKVFNNIYLNLAILLNIVLLTLTLLIEPVREAFNLVLLPMNLTIIMIILALMPIVIVEIVKKTKFNYLFRKSEDNV